MDSDRAHRSGSTSSSTTSELFVCFTSRLSSASSSMKLSSKSLLSPGRARDTPVSLSNSLSRRLRNNGSMKGGQASPMFPTGAKKKGCGFENPEPSSPKVTCIGQVRVKTKKQGKKMRTLSRRRSGREVSFRKVEQSREGVNQSYPPNAGNQHQTQERLRHRNQRWVHLPLTICEGLRAFGAEFSCLFPCRSSCFSTAERDKEEKAEASSLEGNGERSCGAVFARWLVALQEGEGGKERDMELVVREEERIELTERTFRRHVVDEIEMGDERSEVRNEGEDEEEEEARVSICIPPKNALLLMRCRSDPMRMSALASRFWESPNPKDEGEEDDEIDDEDDGDEEEEMVDVGGGDVNVELSAEKEENESPEKWVSEEESEEQGDQETEAKLVMEMTRHPEEEEDEEEETVKPDEKLEMNEELQEIPENQEDEVPEASQTVFGEEKEEAESSDAEALADQEAQKEEKLIEEEEEEEEVEERRASQSSSMSSQLQSGCEDHEGEALLEAADESMEEKETQMRLLEEVDKEVQVGLLEEGEKEVQVRLEKEEEKATPEIPELPEEESPKNHEEGDISGSEERESFEEVERESEVKQEREGNSDLPDCLLLMMCEPKLSMEVSKETWVCSTDFIRWQPERQVKPKDGCDEPTKRVSTESNPMQQLQQPPRSSCSFPLQAAAVAGVSMATMIEQKLASEPFALTRCKSEPMRTASKLAAPDACFWKKRNLEPHRRATAAFGVGF